MPRLIKWIMGNGIGIELDSIRLLFRLASNAWDKNCLLTHWGMISISIYLNREPLSWWLYSNEIQLHYLSESLWISVYHRKIRIIAQCESVDRSIQLLFMSLIMIPSGPCLWLVFSIPLESREKYSHGQIEVISTFLSFSLRLRLDISFGQLVIIGTRIVISMTLGLPFF